MPQAFGFRKKGPSVQNFFMIPPHMPKLFRESEYQKFLSYWHTEALYTVPNSCSTENFSILVAMSGLISSTFYRQMMFQQSDLKLLPYHDHQNKVW